jgi:hypothetical protein
VRRDWCFGVAVGFGEQRMNMPERMQGNLESMDWAEMDDVLIGRMVRHAAQQMGADSNCEDAAAWWWSTAMSMASVIAESDLDSFAQIVNGYDKDGKFRGDFKVTIERVAPRLEAANEGRHEHETKGDLVAKRSFPGALLNKVIKGKFSVDRETADLAFQVSEAIFPVAVQFLFRRMRLLGVVPAFYAGERLAMATGAQTSGNCPGKALKTLAHDLREQFGMSGEVINGVVQGIAEHLVDIDRLPESVGVSLASCIIQGVAMAQSDEQTWQFI